MSSSSSLGVALVTGSAQGIGRGIALRLAADGFDIALNDIPSNKKNTEECAELVKKSGRKVTIIYADISKEDQVQNLIEEVVKQLGGLDVLVANAGILYFETLLGMDTAKWDRIFDVNIKGHMFCFKYAAKQMIKQGRGGRIIGASSFAGKQGLACGSAYSATKFAMRGLIQSAAMELGKYGITVNGYAPGAIDTQMLAESIVYYTANAKEQQGTIDAEFKNKAAMGRVGQPEDIAHLVSFFASKHASFYTGQTIIADGGQLFD